MNKKYIICNLKENKNLAEIKEYKKKLNRIKTNKNIELIISPTSTYLYLLKSRKYNLAAQDVSYYSEGAHTGEISAKQLSSLNVKYVLVGHSERRSDFNENDEILLNKINNSLLSDIQPILFVGETKEEKINGDTSSSLKKQITAIFDKLNETNRNKIILVYEPVWSIGNNETPTGEEIIKTITYIKEILKELYNIEIPILYGGGINISNVKIIADINLLDGIVLGESSKDINNLSDIIKKYSK